MADIPVHVTSYNASSERRISLSWTITHLRARLESVCGIPAGYQKITFRPTESAPPIAVSANNEDEVTLDELQFAPYGILNVDDTRPAGARANYTDVSAVEKFEMDYEDYESRTDSVLAWKKRNQLGRFDPAREQEIASKQEQYAAEIQERGIAIGKRCQVNGDRRGVVKFVGEVIEIPQGGLWVGVQYDEPVGKNDGSIAGVRYFEAPRGYGAFVRPTNLEVGDFPEEEISLSDSDEEM
ncbi:hypothetical protein YB2330_002129 [Saitoella coloradoensis]